MTNKSVKTSKKDKDFRLTKQRIVILEQVRRDDSHPTANAIYSAVRTKYPQISFGTVYRNLNFLTEHGLLKECVIDKKSRYEARVDSHVHFVCEECHSIMDMDSQQDDQLIRELQNLASSKKFMIRSENYEIRGVCKNCQKTALPKKAVPELFCIACGSLLEDLEKEAPVCRECCFQINCSYYPKANK
ncbi:MAG: Fur family transcriptional regulator [Patescibacteria group bacterium]|jgi:Fe2+ or Zn2+ uptake regulation protein